MHFKELIAEKLIVKDPAGRGTVEITGIEIHMFDDRRVLRLSLRLEGKDYCPDISLRDANWTERVQLNVNPPRRGEYLPQARERPAGGLVHDRVRDARQPL